jgi:catechol 2,3-dioxygenase-like lactoylglutathione lyase family enzyme
MAILSGAHTIIYSSDPEADRKVLRDVFELPNVDVGGGWLIFALPPSEVAVHPASTSGKHELYFTVDDVHEFMEHMKQHGLPCSELHQERWGLLTHVTLPGGGQLGVYEPRHPRPTTTA